MEQALRQPLLIELQPSGDSSRRALARAQNFTIERLCGAPGATFAFASASETIVLLPTAGAALSGTAEVQLPGAAIAILPAGSYAITPTANADFYVLATDRIDVDAGNALNADQYATADARVRPVGAPYRRISAIGEVRIHPIADIAIPPDNGRLRFLQSATMSLNWVEYEGVRDRSALSPHAHADLEQASLAIEGSFIHHLRTPWGRNADQWREDQHLPAEPGTVIVIPPEIVHTTEGSGGGRHILVDVFAPPRTDFIARGWVFNAAEYVAAERVPA